MKERKINLVDLLVEILLHWRVFIILMITGAVLLGLLNFIHSRNIIQNQQSQANQMALHPESTFSKEEIQNVNYVIAYENVYLAQKTYIEELPLMNIDPNHVCKAEATIAIISEDRQKSCDIEKVYEDITQSGELSSQVAENIGMKAAEVNEMICLVPRNTAVNNISEDSNTFRIVIMDNDEIQCQNILENVIVFLEEKQPGIESILGEHEIAIVNKSLGIASDPKIAKSQQTALDNIRTLKSVISSMKRSLTDTEQQYYTLLTESTVSTKLNKNYIFLGAVIAAFLYACVLFIIYIFDAKIRITDNLQELYEIPQLGIIPAEKKQKRFFGFIDEWILALRNRNKRQFTREEALELAFVAIKISAEKETLHEITLMGCGLKDHSLDTCEKLRAHLIKDNIQINILNNVLYDAQMMNELERTKSVVLVEGAGSTLCNEIADELELLKRQGIKVLGGILVE